MAIGAIQATVFLPDFQNSAQQAGRNANNSEATTGEPEKRAEEARPSVTATSKNGVQLSEADLKQVEALKKRDREVRAHEQAHVAAAGGLAKGGPKYDVQYGPDGQAYAVGGEVNIDTSPGRTPEETIQKAKQIRAAALAPAEPSGQDRAVAAAAAQLETQAQQELAVKGNEENNSNAADKQPAEAGNAVIPAENRHAIALYGAIASAGQPAALVHVQA